MRRRGLGLAMMVLWGVCTTLLGQERAADRQVRGAEEAATLESQIQIPENVELRQDVIFGKGGERDLKLYLYLPKGEGGLRAGIVFIHGGGWKSRMFGQFQSRAAYMAGKGYVCACVEYRLSDEAKFPAAVEDVKCAVRWMRAHAEELKVDPDRIAAVGDSAGGHLAALVGVMDKEDDLEGTGGYAEYSSKANAVVAFNGVFDFPKMGTTGAEGLIAQFLGGTPEEAPETYRKASPVTYVDGRDAPFLLLHGTADKLVPMEQTMEMKEALEKSGVKAELYVAEGARHGFGNGSPQYEKTLEAMEKFLAGVLAPKEKPVKRAGRFEGEFKIPDDVNFVEDVVYGKGGGRDLKLYLFLPKEGKSPRPAIVFIHGGGWRSGSPKSWFRHGAEFARRGYVGACVEYRLSDEAKFPAAVEDVKCAVRWMRANAERYGVNPDWIASMGVSAGAHLAAMLGVMDKEDDLEGTGGYEAYSSKVNAVVAFSGAYDFSNIPGRDRADRSEEGDARNMLVGFLGGTRDEMPEVYRRASPVTYVDGRDTPFFFGHGTDDSVVPVAASAMMKDALEKAGVRAELFVAQGGAHGFPNDPAYFDDVVNRVDAFLREVFGEAK